MLNNWLKNNLSKFLPPGSCCLCDAPVVHAWDLCGACSLELPRSSHRCRICALPLGNAGDDLCGHCMKQKPAFDQCLTVYAYAHPMDYLVRRFKYHQDLQVGRLLGQLWQQDVLARPEYLIDPPQCLLPVPLHPNRLRQRGFNQALEMIRPAAKSLNIPVSTAACARIVDTAQQSSMTAKNRKTNIKHAFSANLSSAYHIAVIDDVMTTGATADAVAHCLKQAGVEKVSIWVLARAS